MAMETDITPNTVNEEDDEVSHKLVGSEKDIDFSKLEKDIASIVSSVRKVMALWDMVFASTGLVICVTLLCMLQLACLVKLS